MNNRWGRQIEPKGSLKSSGQNNINININFNAVKDKANVFGGKKLDNFIQINNQPKSAISRPNVSMQTLKQKKKKSINRQQHIIEQQLQRKRSKSKIINQVSTPQKIWKDRPLDNSKSIGKKSTKKRSTKSFDNLKKFYGRSSPRQDSKEYEISQSGETSKDHSRQKSKSRSKSNKKIAKNISKQKNQTSSTNLKVKNQNHNSKKQLDEDKNIPSKSKKMSLKNQRTVQLDRNSHINQAGTHHNFGKKPVSEGITRKKSGQVQNKKAIKIKTPKRSSIQKQAKGLKRLPLFYEEQSEGYDEQKDYKKLEKEVQTILYGESRGRVKKESKKQRHQKQQCAFGRYIRRDFTADDLIYLNKSATIIQRNWRGYKARTQFVNELNMMNHKIQITRNKIANLDPKFWDDAKSNSILKAEDAQSVRSSEAASELYSDLKKPVSEHSISGKQKLEKKRSIQSQAERKEMLERILRLQQNVKKFQVLNEQLCSENKELKVNLQRVTMQSGANSGAQSMEESLKSDHSWEVAFKFTNKPGQDPFLEEESVSGKQQDKQFNIRMPNKIENSGLREIKKKQKEDGADVSHESALEKYKAKVSKYECSSPKYSSKININSSVLELMQKKEDQLKQSFEKKVGIFDRMLNDSIVSPRTYTIKKNELQEKFKHESQMIRTKKQQITRVAQYIKQIEEEQPKIIQKTKELSEEIHKPSILHQQNHVIEDYGNLNLNSHRSKSESQECDQFESSLQSQKSSKDPALSKYKQIESQAINKIEDKNNEAIRIFQEVSEQQNIPEELGIQQNSSSCSVERPKESQIQNSSSVSAQPKKQPRGFETTLLFIKEYCVSFVEFIRNSVDHKCEFIEGICSPIVYDSFQFLKAYRTTTSHQNDSTYNSHEKQYIYPYFKLLFSKSQSISRDAFAEFNQTYEKLQCECLCKADREFFLNSLFDAFNQSLDYKRPCSIYGQPPVWISESRGLKNHYLTKQDLSEKQNFLVSQKFDEICGLAIARVIEWSTSLCGFIPESPEMENLVIEQEQINHIRETRIALMLEKDLLENQQYMLDSIIEQTEVKLQISQMLSQFLINELCDEARLFFK